MRAVFGLVVAAAALAACSLLTSYDDLRDGGSASDAPIDNAPAPNACTLAITPSLVTINPVVGTNVTLTLARGAGLVGGASVSYNPGVAFVTPPSLAFAASDNSVSGPFTLQPGASPLAKDVTITATFADNTHCQAIATIAIPGVLATFPNGTQTTFVVPQTTFLTRLEIAAWGAGGGGGGNYGSQSNGGNGGAGGLSYAFIDVTPGETLTAIAGTGGNANTSQFGGGGGGCAEVLRGTTLLVVGSGGGGGGGTELNSYGGSGGAGGQSAGGNAGGGAGTTTTGGAGGATGGTAGVAFDGGKGGGSNSGSNGGVPGGGRGGLGGGGGCGVFGGGGGGNGVNAAGGGGGGGGGFITGDGGVLIGAGQFPKLDPTWAADASVNALGAAATGGTGSTDPQSSTSATFGGGGRVVISIAP